MQAVHVLERGEELANPARRVALAQLVHPGDHGEELLSRQLEQQTEPGEGEGGEVSGGEGGGGKGEGGGGGEGSGGEGEGSGGEGDGSGGEGDGSGGEGEGSGGEGEGGTWRRSRHCQTSG
eukprot:scaffold51584_cov69-Phaeocystis_antarctica.AAC.5